MPGQKVHRSLVFRLAALFALGSALGAQPDKTPLGDVLQVQGNWLIAGQAPHLLAGEGVAGGSLIQSDAGRKNDIIVVVLLNGQRLVATCSTSPCRATIEVPETYLNADVS